MRLRRVFGALVGMALAPSAFAGDLDTLRGTQSVGPATYTRWSGFYVGGQYGWGDAAAGFGGATQPLLAYSLRETTLDQEDAVSGWQILQNATNGAAGYGVFGGYNMQFQDLILGLEGSYTHTHFDATGAASPISRQVSAGGSTYNVTETGTASLQMSDYGSLRARAGWVVNNFLPYGFAGLAVGKASYSITSNVTGQENPSSPAVVPCDTTLSPSCIDFSYSNASGKSFALAYGFAVGGGLDIALTSNVFLRGEYEYDRFAPLSGIAVTISSARAGAGFKF